MTLRSPARLQPIRQRRQFVLAAALIAAILAAAGCGSNAAAPPVTDAPATTTAAPSPTPTTSTPLTTAPPSTTVEDAVRAVHTRVMTEMFARDERVTGPETMLPLAQQLTTGPLLQRIRDSVADELKTGERTASPGYDSHIVRVSLASSSSATVLDCSQDRSVGYAADGSISVPADTFYKYRQSVVTLIDGRWLVSDIYAGGDQRCTP